MENNELMVDNILEQPKKRTRKKANEVEKDVLETVEQEVFNEAVKEDTPKLTEEPQTEQIAKETKKETKKQQTQVQETKDSVGILSDDIIQNDRYNPYEKEENLLAQIKTYVKEKQILWGTVTGLVRSEALNKSIVSILWNGVEIQVPIDEYFEPYYKITDNFDALNDKQKDDARRKLLKYQLGARVCVMPKLAIKKETDVGNKITNQSPFTIVAFGSRKEAMAKLRNIYFLHKAQNEKEAATFKEIPSIGDICKARVISVRNDVAVVECLGVETRIDAYDLSDLTVENCRDFVKPGDTMKVRIKKLYLNEDNSVYLSVSGRLNDTGKVLNTMMVGSMYLGKVEKFNKDNHTYLIHLKNGVNAFVYPENVESKTFLFRGEQVAVVVEKIKDNYVTGKAIKI